MADAIDTLRAQQHAFTAHLRDPQAVPAPAGLDARRLAVYQHLLFNNLLGLLSNGFPVCVRLLGEPAWSALVRHYFATHRCQTPLFTELAAEFVQWLQAQPQLPHPALAELAHYEWVETALYQLQAEPLPAPGDVDPLRVPLQRSPLAWPLLYQWPVHRLGAEDAPTQPPQNPPACWSAAKPTVKCDSPRSAPWRCTCCPASVNSLGWKAVRTCNASPPRMGWPKTRWPAPVPRCCGSSCRPA